MSKLYFGFFNYKSDKNLDLTKCIINDDDKGVVNFALQKHALREENSIEDYHISEYEGDWERETGDAPVKVGEYKVEVK